MMKYGFRRDLWKAVITLRARSWRLPQVLEKHAPAATPGPDVSAHRAAPGFHGGISVPGWAGRFLSVELEVARNPKEFAAALISIPAGAAGLLVVALRPRWYPQVYHEPHIRLVDSHSERAGGDHHADAPAEELGQQITSRIARQAGMVRSRRVAPLS